MQLCVNVQIPEALGGIAGESVYIDTSRGFNPKRFRGMSYSPYFYLLKWEIYPFNIIFQNYHVLVLTVV